MGWGFRIRFQSKDGTLKGERVVFGLPVRIGRNALNDCQILHAFVSDFHAVIELVDGRLAVRDLQSRNGVQTVAGEAIGRGGPYDLSQIGNQFVIGRFVSVSVEMFERKEEVGARFSSTNGTVLGNRAVLDSLPQVPPQPPPQAQPPAGWRASAPPGAVPGVPGVPGGPMGAMPGMPGMGPQGMPAVNPQMSPPHGIPQQHMVPPTQAMPQGQPLPTGPMAQHGPTGPMAQHGPSLPPGQGMPPGMPPPGNSYPTPPPPGQRAPTNPNAAAVAAGAVGGGLPVSRSTQHFAMSTETLALLGLRELASSFVPGVRLETTGDVARLLTKLHDAFEVFCKCFIPLREGYAQFVSSMDLNRAVSQRSLSRSVDAMRVQAARDPAALAAALLDWRSQNYDAPQVVESILADLMIHHVAVIEGVTRGVAALLDELSPARIEQATNDANAAAFFGKYKALWNAFQARHEELMNETRRFELVFGQDFAATYRNYLAKQRSTSG